MVINEVLTTKYQSHKSPRHHLNSGWSSKLQTIESLFYSCPIPLTNSNVSVERAPNWVLETEVDLCLHCPWDTEQSPSFGRTSVVKTRFFPTNDSNIRIETTHSKPSVIRET